MSGFERKVKRNILKKELGTNKIRIAFHERYDTLEKRMKNISKERGKGNENKSV